MKLSQFILAIVFICSIGYANNNDMYVFNNTVQKQQFMQLTYAVRCLVCQNQNIAESNAALASDLRSEIAGMIMKGYSNNQIENYLITRYGDYILFKPPVVKNTWLLWYGPFILLFFGLAVLYLAIFLIGRREQRHGITNIRE